MCKGFSRFLAFLHHFLLAKIATSSIKVNILRSLDAADISWGNIIFSFIIL